MWFRKAKQYSYTGESGGALVRSTTRVRFHKVSRRRTKLIGAGGTTVVESTLASKGTPGDEHNATHSVQLYQLLSLATIDPSSKPAQQLVESFCSNTGDADRGGRSDTAAFDAAQSDAYWFYST